MAASPRSRALLASALLLAVAATAVADVVQVENWARHAAGATGVPEGWRKYETPGGHPAYDVAIVEDGGRKALRMRSRDDHTTIARDVQVDLKRTPILEWTWKITALPAGADVRRKETSDMTAHVYVVWPRFPALVRSRLIGYGWDPMAPAGSVEGSRKTGTVTFFILHSGTAELGRWITERRDIVADYRRIYGQAPENPGAIALSIDTNDTRAFAEGLIGTIRFVSEGAPAVR
jgi:hypothetical protein